MWRKASLAEKWGICMHAMMFAPEDLSAELRIVVLELRSRQICAPRFTPGAAEGATMGFKCEALTTIGCILLLKAQNKSGPLTKPETLLNEKKNWWPLQID